jgi:hypothetical protein
LTRHTHPSADEAKGNAQCPEALLAIGVDAGLGKGGWNAFGRSPPGWLDAGGQFQEAVLECGQ